MLCNRYIIGKVFYIIHNNCCNAYEFLFGTMWDELIMNLYLRLRIGTVARLKQVFTSCLVHAVCLRKCLSWSVAGV